MESEFTKPSIIRLARQAGVKNISEDVYDEIRKIINKKLNEIIQIALIVNDEKQTKTLLVDDLIDALKLSGEYISKSEDLTTNKL